MNTPTYFLLLALCMLLATACDTTGELEPEPPEELFPAPVNERISELRYCCHDPFNEGQPAYGSGSYSLTEWHPDTAYTIRRMRQMNLQETGSGYTITGEQYHEMDPVDGDGRPVTYFTLSPTEHTIYFIVTNLFLSRESEGELRTYDLHTNTISPPLRDSTYNISSIRIREKPDGSLLKVYYSYGNPDTGLEAGYYRLSEAGPPDELLLAHANPNGPRETINGFDLSPDGTTLLYPIHHAFVPGHAYGGPPPELATLNLETGAKKILPVEFTLQQFLWARYHPGGDKIVVSNYPRNILGYTSVDVDSMYIVDLDDYSRRPLDTRTETYYYTPDVFPSWSPDGQFLIYGSAPMGRSDFSIGTYSIYTMDMRED
jgi:hypothetical protein